MQDWVEREYPKGTYGASAVRRMLEELKRLLKRQEVLL
jgi:hypothetical protein